ncbi:MAG: hypothetical protein KDA28_09185, partial [Phycisphaerales bacterium]|nr:hypothetical protein [Phycisphaerales bacterium]
MTASSAARVSKATDPRAASILALAAQATRFPDCLPLDPDTASLDERDAALAHRIYDVAMRRWHTLEFLLGRHLRQEFRALEPRMRAVLLSGAAQIVFLDRVPTHAAIDESVEWAKRHIRPKAGGMVNAVLRKVASDLGDTTDEARDDRAAIPRSDGRFIELREAILPDDDLTRLVVTTSVPRWVLDTWCAAHGVPRAWSLALHAIIEPPIIVNTAHATAPVPDDWLAHESPGHHVATGVAPLATRRDLWAQDPSSSASVDLASSRRPAL